MVSKLIQVMIAAVIGMALLPVVVEFSEAATPVEAGIIGTLVGLVPVLYIIILVAGLASYVVASSRT